MPSDKALLALHDIQNNSRLAREFLGTLSHVELKADRRTFYAVCRCPEIVSEAARRLPAPVRERHPELPWRLIFGVGNVYRHDYDNVSAEIVWQTVHDRLPTLESAIAAEIARANSPPTAD